MFLSLIKQLQILHFHHCMMTTMRRESSNRFQPAFFLDSSIYFAPRQLKHYQYKRRNCRVAPNSKIKMNVPMKILIGKISLLL